MRQRLLLVFALMPALAACQSTPPSPPSTRTAASPGLQARLTCRVPALLNEASAATAAALAGDSALRCRIQTRGGPNIECRGSPDVALFGLPVRHVSVFPPDGIERSLGVELGASATTVAAAAGRALGVPMRAVDNGDYRFTRLGADVASYLVRALPGGNAVFRCGLPVAGVGALRPIARPPGWAVLSGSVSFPSEYFPPMRVCALGPEDPGRGYCTDTPQHEPHYRLAVPAGRWWLLAWPRDTGVAPGRHSMASACIDAGRTGCDEHALRAIDVIADEARAGIDINDWYADPRIDPPPTSPRPEPLPE